MVSVLGVMTNEPRWRARIALDVCYPADRSIGFRSLHASINFGYLCFNGYKFGEHHRGMTSVCDRIHDAFRFNLQLTPLAVRFMPPSLAAQHGPEAKQKR